MNILIKYPTKNRPERFKSTLQRYIDFISGEHIVNISVNLDNDDTSGYDTKDFYVGNTCVTFSRYDTKNKIEAVNVGIKYDFDILILASDDMIPVKRGYDDIIANDFLKHYPNGYGALWYFDGYRKDLCTLAIMDKQYYNKFGYIYHPDYKSLWCDNEYTQVGKSLGRLTFINNCIIKHDHYENSNLMPDELYIRNAKYEAEDRETFKKRQAKNFTNEVVN